MNNLNQAYAHIKTMRVVPFDTRSFGQLFGSTFGSLIPVLLQAVGTPPVVIKVVDDLKSLFLG